MAGLWVFDVDGTLIDSMSGRQARPLAEEVLTALYQRRIEIVVWSAGGADYAERKTKEVGLHAFVTASEAKASRDANGYWDASHIVPLAGRATFVDDQPHEIDPDATVLGVRTYIGENPYDRGLAAVLAAAKALRA